MTNQTRNWPALATVRTTSTTAAWELVRSFCLESGPAFEQNPIPQFGAARPSQLFTDAFCPLTAFIYFQAKFHELITPKII